MSENSTYYTCLSTHLTTFAVLVSARSVQVAIIMCIVLFLCLCRWFMCVDLFYFKHVIYKPLLLYACIQDIPSIEKTALSIVTYIGCSVSIVCLLLTLILLVVLR